MCILISMSQEAVQHTIPSPTSVRRLEESTEQTKAGGCERRGRNGKELCVLANRLQKEQGGEAAVGWLCERHHRKAMEGQKETRRLIDTLMTLYMTSRRLLARLK